MSDETLILAIETARRRWTVSLLRDAEEISFESADAAVSSSAVLLRTIDSMLRENEISLADLSAIAVSTGPGSFTGIRVGIATAQALALGAKKECFGVTLFEALTLEALAVDQTQKVFPKNILTAIFAGQNQVYWQLSNAEIDRSETNKDVSIEVNLPARLDELADFADELRELRKIFPDLLISADFDIESDNAETSTFHIASDNLSKYVAFHCRNRNRILNKIQAENTENGRDSLIPLYLREIRIGRL